MLIFGWPLTVYGKLGKTAVGTHERGLFIAFQTPADMRATIQQICDSKAPLEPDKISGVLLELARRQNPASALFRAGQFPGVKVVAGESMLTSVRQRLTALLSGVLAFMAIMFVSTGFMVSVLFSAIITERRRELGLLRAVGACRSQIVGMLLTEAGVATAVGGIGGCVLGLLLMRVYERSLVYHLESMGIRFLWLGQLREASDTAARLFDAQLIVVQPRS
jgi:putative ABC transport system permease protein